MKTKIIEIIVNKNSGILETSDLPVLRNLVLDEVINSGYDCLYVISGRLPVWAYSYLTGLLHNLVAGIGVYEPRTNTVIVTARKTSEIPTEGTVLQAGDDRIKVIL